jgi:hypothetical protein
MFPAPMTAMFPAMAIVVSRNQALRVFARTRAENQAEVEALQAGVKFDR